MGRIVSKNEKARDRETSGNPERDDGPPGICHGKCGKGDAINKGGLYEGANSASRGAFVTDSRN